MNDLNLNSPSVLNPDQEQLVRKLVAAILSPTQKGECRCHWIDANKTPILVWKSTKDPDVLVMKIATQKLIGLSRSDKKNEIYWKFRNVEEGVPISKTPSNESVRQQNEVPAEQTSVQLEQSPGSLDKESEAVKNFREKYGTASEPKRSS